VILVQAGAARLLGARDPAAVRGALQTIEDVARDTIEEIDRLVGALRDDAGAAAARFVGMRERAALAGGTLEAGADGGRFVVRADLPDAPERG
jgi:signal transduction histidine kinase